MFTSLINIFRIPELRNKVIFTLFMLAIYRIGYHVPLPGVNQEAFRALDEAQREEGGTSAAARLAQYVAIFSGGNLSQSTIFGLGIMPYISASIIFQLLITVVPTLEKLQKEGETGRRKIQEWTRYATVPLCMIQATFWLSYMHSEGADLVFRDLRGTVTFWVMGITALTAGTIFLMWLGEQIDEYGLGNGISLIILAGIVARMPTAIMMLIEQSDLTIGGGEAGRISIGQVLFLVFSFIFIVATAILITQAQRRIPIQQAKHTRGRKVYGGQRQYLPLRVNHGGVMPIIFAQSLMLFPGVLLGWLAASMATAQPGFFPSSIHWLNVQFGYGRLLHILTELGMIYFFAYFWTTVQFRPKEMADQLRDYGSFIPGMRPGKRTADYLEKVMMRITYVGAAFLCVVAVVPTAVNISLGIPYMITQFLGGTGLLIVVSVALDMVQRIEANLLMRNYSGFLSGPGGGKGRRIKGRQH
jgi:preprotein translocase subunit SecY